MKAKSTSSESAEGSIGQLERGLRQGLFTVTAELTPPVSTNPEEFIRRGLTLKGLAAAVNITDGAVAKAHLSSLVAAHFLIRNGIEPILQMTCRDRNRIALQGDLLGAVALGVRNVLVVHGDDPKREDTAICVEILQQLAATPGIAGAHIMAPQFFSAVPEVIAASGVTGKMRAALPR